MILYMSLESWFVFNRTVNLSQFGGMGVMWQSLGALTTSQGNNLTEPVVVGLFEN